MRNFIKIENKGYTLVEVMVALLITFVVLGGVYRTVLNENVDLEKEEIILDMQNNARIAMERVFRAVRGSGFMGCSGEIMVNTLTNAETTPNAPSKPTLLSLKTSAVDPNPGNDAFWVPNPNLANGRTLMNELRLTADVNWLGEPIGFYNDTAGGHTYYQPGTDAITLGFLVDEVALANAMVATNANINLAAGAFEEGDILLITDCQDYSVFQKSNCDGTALLRHNAADNCLPAGDYTQLNSGNDLGKDYGSKAQARVFKLDFETFFIADDGGNPNLHHNLTNMPIANNIEDLQFEFYFDLNQNDDLTDDVWQQTITGVTFDGTAIPVTARDIRVVRIYILARSEAVYSFSNTNTYDYPNSPYYSGVNPFASANGGGGSPASQAPMANDGEHRYRYLALKEIYIRNAGLIN